MRRILVSLLLLTTALACGEKQAGQESPDASVTPPVDLTVAMFDPNRVLRISIDMDPADWDDLRTQTRSILDVLGSSCLAEPPERPFTYFQASVTIDGETTTNVGVRKKGFFGSLSETKPSLKVKFSEYDDAQRFSGLQRMTLNNAISDASYVKQCIGYDLFTQAGVPAPRCNFATVEVNGENMGLYVHVESIKKRFIARHFDDNDGNLYEGALSDFRAGWIDTFQKKTNKDIADRSDINALVPIMNADDSQFLSDVDRIVDVDRFITMWAAELLMMHADGYARNTNNFYMYNDPTTGKFSFIPWGIDSIMFGDATLPWEDTRPPVAAWAEGVLSRRLYNVPEMRTRYFTKLNELLATIWDEDALHAEINRMEALIEDHVVVEETTQFRDNLELVRDFVDTRRATIEAALDPEPSWSGPLRDPWCIENLGNASGTFNTTFGTLESNDPLNEGTATLSATLNGQPFNTMQTGATAGFDPDSGKPAVRIVSLIGATQLLLVQLVIDEQVFTDGASMPIDWLDAQGYALTLDFGTMPDPTIEVVGIVGDGMLTLTKASTGTGMEVSGSFNATIYEPFF